jgi:superfamily II DNA/RNA helicase
MQLSKLKARSKEIDSSNQDLNPILSEFGSLGLYPDIVSALSAQSITVPTPVQRSVIPRLLARENIVMAASTGSGKTLAYALPAVQVG